MHAINQATNLDIVPVLHHVLQARCRHTTCRKIVLAKCMRPHGQVIFRCRQRNVLSLRRRPEDGILVHGNRISYPDIVMYDHIRVSKRQTPNICIPVGLNASIDRAVEPSVHVVAHVRRQHHVTRALQRAVLQVDLRVRHYIVV